MAANPRKPRRKRGTVAKSAGRQAPLDHLKLDEMLQLALRSRKPFESDWWMNVAYISGAQQVSWNLDTNRILELELPDGDDLPIRNFMLKISRTERAKVLKTIPSPVATPLSDDSTDEHEARIMNAWFEFVKDEWKFEKRLRTAVFWAIATGNVFFKWFWSDGMPQMTVVNPFDMFIDPYADTMMDARWMIHRLFMSMEEAHETYGDAGNTKMLTESTVDTQSGVESKIFTNLGFGTAEHLPGVYINEYYQPPRAKDPAGRYIVYTQHGVIYDKPYPYDHNQLPFTHMGHIERANSKYYASIMDAVRLIQDEANRAESRNIQNANISQGTWFLPMTLELDAEPDGSPRQILRQIGGDPGLEPIMITPNSLPAWVAEEPNRLQAVAEDISGQHEVSNAGVPGRVEAAQAIQLLQEADDELLKDVMHSMEEAVADGFFMTASNTRQFGDPQIVVQAYDKSGRIEVDTMKTDELKLNFRIRVTTTTALPQTISGKWDRVMTLLDRQAIPMEQALKMLGLTNENPDLNQDQTDRNNQYRYNKTMAKGTVVRPSLWENHQACLEELDKYRKTAEFAELPDRVKMIFSFHEYERKKMRLQVAQEEAQLQQLIQIALGQEAPGGGAAPATQPPMAVPA
jgi:hypothetical protein